MDEETEPASTSEAADPLFADVDKRDTSSSSKLIKNQNLLEVGMVPDEDRIVGRDNEIEEIATNLRPIVVGNVPTPVLVYGKTGTGKSLVSQHVSGRARKAADRRDRNIVVPYIDCSQHSSKLPHLTPSAHTRLGS